MPLDTLNIDGLSTTPDLSKPTLKGLAWLLRHPEKWPNHSWDFSDVLTKTITTERYGFLGLMRRQHCGTSGCAMGLCILQWEPALTKKISHNRYGNDDALKICQNIFGIDKKTATKLFWEGANDICVTPTVVADRIDDHLAGAPIRYLNAGDCVPPLKKRKSTK